MFSQLVFALAIASASLTATTLIKAPPPAPAPVSNPAVTTPADPVPELGRTAGTSARIDVVFVLDTTGSMSALIEGAKQKIWAIANAMATAEPVPEIRMGLVGYRDRNDAYITKLTDLTEDLDLVYAELMGFTADGGGDEPESVNQALHEAVTMMAWDERPETLKLVYLVGDAPPHMDYQDDVKYEASCKIAAESGLIINTIQCGATASTTPIWKAIASSAEGEYFAIAQSGGMRIVETPFDANLAELGNELSATVLCYGTKEELAQQTERVQRSQTIEGCSTTGALACRAVWNASSYGFDNLVGQQELLNDIETKRVKLEDVETDALPESMQAMSLEERQAYVTERIEERKAIQTKIQVVNKKRDAFLAEQTDEEEASFDAKVLESLERQAERCGISYDLHDAKAEAVETESSGS